MVINIKILRNYLVALFAGSVLSLVIVTTLPLFIFYQNLIACFAKFFRPDLESIVSSGADMFFAVDILHCDTKSVGAYLITFTLKSKPSYEKVHKFFQEVLTEKKYERMCQYIVPWMGYGFWKREKPFLLENHLFVVRRRDDEVQDDKWLNNFTKKLVKDPFGKMQSPWDVHIVTDYQPTPGSHHVSAVMLRIHHSLSDGHSTFQMLSRAFGDHFPLKYEKPIKATSFSKLEFFMTRLLSPFTVINFFMESYDWKNRIIWTNFSGKMSLAHLKLPIEKILLVRKKYKGGINSIIFAGVISALRNILLRKNSKIPPNIHFGFPLPKEGHPDYLCNHASGTFLPFPIGHCDPVIRLVNINSRFDEFSASKMTERLDFLFYLLGYLPHYLVHALPALINLPGGVTVMPLGSQNEIFGCPIGDYQVSCSIPLMEMNAGFIVMGVINNGYVYLSGAFDESILATDELACQTMKDIDRYFDSLLQN